jgi:hypothetical protein
MTFFYDLNKKLAAVGTESTNQQLNERKELKSYSTDALKAASSKDSNADKKSGVDPQYSTQQIKDELKRRTQEVDEGLGDMARKVGSVAKKVGGKVLDKLGHGDDAEMMRDLQRKMGATGTQVHGKKSMAKPNEGVDKAAFAKLAPPTDKITFADKIAGAKKEVDEMLGDVAAEAMKSALSGGQKKLDKNDNGKLDANDFAMLRKGGKQKTAEEDDNNPFTSWKKPRAEKPKVGSTERGALHDIEHTATGRKVTRRVDQNTGYSVGSDDDKPADGEKRGRGRPKGAAKAPERVTANATKHKGGRKTTEDYGPMEGEGDNELKAAMTLLKKAGYKISKGEQELDEKAVSKKQQKFMGMVHATQKGEKAPSKEVAKVAKSMGKKDAEDFASTKHKGLPEKKAKKEKTEETTDSTPSKGGMKFGGGIYDSMNRDLENMIAESMSQLNESMSVNMSDSTEGGKSLTITASDDDALKLATLLKSAGLGGGDSEGYGGAGYKSACGCGTPDCSCGDEEMDEAAPAVSDNEPNWPTNTETSDDALQYSGGLNKPKSTGQSTVPVLASQDDRQHSYAEAEEDALHRMMEMAGIAEAKGEKPDFLDADKDGDKEESFKKAVDDKKEKKVDEGILASTANLWKEYKGQYGV